MIIRTIALVVALYIAYAGAFFLVQRALLYPGTRLGPGPSGPGTGAAPANARRVAIQTSAGGIDAWYVPPDRLDRPGAAALVFHGNAELAIDMVAPFRRLGGLGVAALFVEYPGFGGRPGSPSERSIMETAAAAYDWLAARAEIDETRMFAIGRSLGTGPAAALSGGRPIKALVLWSPFVSVGYLALRKYGLPPFLARDRFDTRAALGAFEGSVLIFHGRRDGVIPFRNAEVLARTGGDVELVAWDCGHNDCPPAWPELWEPLTHFLARNDLLPPADRREGNADGT